VLDTSTVALVLDEAHAALTEAEPTEPLPSPRSE
jgi:hypothetical protein